MINQENLTYAIFEPGALEPARELARQLRARNHRVSIHEGNAFSLRELPLRGVAVRRGIIGGVALVASLAIAALAVGLIAGMDPFAGPLGPAHLVAAVALAIFFGGLAGLIGGTQSPAPELQDAEEALGQPGRFALTVSTTRARRGFVESELERAGALAVGSL